MLIASPKELQVSNVDYVVVFEGTKKYHVAIADVVNPFTLHVVIPGLSHYSWPFQNFRPKLHIRNPEI